MIRCFALRLNSRYRAAISTTTARCTARECVSLATAADEILPLKDPRVAKNPAYLVVILLSRVVVRLGQCGIDQPQIIENLFIMT